MTTKGIIFDLDNTLTDRRLSVRVFAQRFANDFDSKLRPISFHDLELVIQNGDQLGFKPKEEMFREMEQMLPWRVPVAADDLGDYWYRVSPSCMRLRDGLENVLDSLLRQDYRLGIITNGRTTVQNATIDALGIRERFDVIIVSETVNLRKPDGAIFELALRELDLQADDVLYVGDHPRSDMLGAYNAGIRGVWVRSGGHAWDDDVPQPFASIDQMRELPGLVD